MNRDLIFLHWIVTSSFSEALFVPLVEWIVHPKLEILSSFTQASAFTHIQIYLPKTCHTRFDVNDSIATYASCYWHQTCHNKPHLNAHKCKWDLCFLLFLCAVCMWMSMFVWNVCLFHIFYSPNPDPKLTEFLLHIGPQGFWSLSDQFSCAVNIYSERGINNKLCPQRPPVLLLYLHAMASATRGTKSA